MGWYPKASPKCPSCSGAVYPVEQIIVTDRQPYHRWCVRCVICYGKLTMGSLNEHEGSLFCKNCYQTIYNPQCFRALGLNNGRLSEEDRQRILREMQERQARIASGQPVFDSSSGSPSAPPIPASELPFGGNISDVDFSKGGMRTVSSGIDVSGLMTIAPREQIVPLGY